ncbi:MAG: preprotein translocase subunit SecY [Bdellovibrionales bacterium]
MAVNENSKNTDLTKRILFTLGMLAVYRIGVHVPTPGVDPVAVMGFFKAQSQGIFGLFNTFTGGALEQFSVFALGIMPYISASIIFQLLTSAIPTLESLKKEGPSGQRKIQQYTRYATILLAIVQGYGMSTWLMNSDFEGTKLVLSPYVGFLPFKLVTIMTLTAGTCFVMWLGEQITDRGIGNGSSLIIFTGIAASIPSGAQRLLLLVQNNEIKAVVAILIVLAMIAIIAGVIYMEVAQRRITIQYSQRGQMGPQSMAAPTSHLPIKINFSGVIPPIFASSLLMFPATMAQFTQTPWLKNLQDSLNPSGVIFNILFVALIIFFSFFYTEIVFNSKDVAENLKKYGGFIPGVRAGSSTADYIQKVLERVNVAGCTYLSIVCVLPVVLQSHFALPFYFGGTSLLILVGVALDTAQQIQSHLLTTKYEGFLKGAKIRSRRVQF